MIMERIKKFNGFINESTSKIPKAPEFYRVSENGDVVINVNPRENVSVLDSDDEFVIYIQVGDLKKSISIPKKSIDFDKYQDDGIIRVLGESRWAFSDSNISDMYDFLYDFSNYSNLPREENDELDYLYILLPLLRMDSGIKNIQDMGDSTFSIELDNGTSINLGLKSGILTHFRAYKEDSQDLPYIDIARKKDGSNGCVLLIGEDRILIDYLSILELSKNPIFNYITAEHSNGSVDRSREIIISSIEEIMNSSSDVKDLRTKEMKDLIIVASDFLESEEIERLIK